MPTNQPIATPWQSRDEIVIFAIVGIIGAIIGANALRAYRKVKP